MATRIRRGYFDPNSWPGNYWGGRYWPGWGIGKPPIIPEREIFPLLDVEYDIIIEFELQFSAHSEFIPFIEKKEKAESELYLLDDFWLFEDEE